MTKRVRIENADNAIYKVVVQIWDKSFDGSPDVLVEERLLPHPCDMTDPCIHSGRYLVVKEA